MKTSKAPMSGIFLAIIDTSQIENTEFAGEDKFDRPQSGELLRIHPNDEDVLIVGAFTLKDMLGKKIYWAKYAESDALFFDNELQKDVVFIALDKLRGYED